jgi:hypothetical protein
MKPSSTLNENQKACLHELRAGTKLPVLIKQYGRGTLAFLHSHGHDLPRVLSVHGQRLTYED